ncbi:Redoxin [Guyanagaster necrorhizus]|uniref:Redoxin n=1 Tax=Guyanagaster necrorhizus TaxID=856835 RepID=A0A9P7VKD6_9AGAR|nr:Redoxin [Guyanagaster necrorhizus MCA 3950]KAG7442107.1 Redoxin [Guyanagaster necrorhizus MCA 3950]
MSSLTTGAIPIANSAAATLLSASQITPGKPLPPLTVKETSPEHAETVSLTGKNIIIGVPGAFTGTCSAQIPGYIEEYEAFKAKGVEGIYVVGVNDQFVMNAWKEKLAPNSTPIHFLADDQATFTGATGLVFDATPLLGTPRSKRYVMIVNDNQVMSLAVEEDPDKVTVTSAKTILTALSFMF